MDDIICIHNDKKYLKYCLEKINKKLEKYKLRLNIKKTKIDSIKNGLDFLGYRFIIKNDKVILKVRKRVKKNFKKKIKALNILFKYKYIDKNEYDNLMCSYKGIFKWGDCGSLRYNCLK